MRSNRRRAWQFAASVLALLLYNLYVIHDYNAASDPLKSISEATAALSDPETHFSFEADGIHDIWLLLPRGMPVQQTLQSRDEIVQSMSATLDGKRLELTDSRGFDRPQSEVCGNDTLTYLTGLDAYGEVELTVKTMHHGVVPVGSKVIVETTAAESDGAAIDLELSTALRNHLGMTDAVAALALVIIGAIDIIRSKNSSINRPQG